MAGEELVLDSLRRRISAMHSLWREAASTQGLEQVNHFERAGVLPIAFSLNHLVRIEDQTIQTMMLSRPPIWNAGGWAERVGVTVDDAGKELSVAEMEQIRFGDYEAFKAYMEEVFAVTEAYLGGLEAVSLADILFGGATPALLKNTFSARVVAGGPFTRMDGIECWVFQHGIRHLGEMEHARALVGLGGLTS